MNRITKKLEKGDKVRLKVSPRWVCDVNGTCYWMDVTGEWEISTWSSETSNFLERHRIVNGKAEHHYLEDVPNEDLEMA